MKNFGCICFVLLFAFTGFSQKLQIGVEFTPMLNYSHFPFGDTIYSGFHKRPYTPLSTGGPYIKYNINNKWSILVGYHMMRSGYTTYILYDYNYPATKEFGDRTWSASTLIYEQIPILIQHSRVIKENTKYFIRLGTRTNKIPKGYTLYTSKGIDLDNKQDTVRIEEHMQAPAGFGGKRSYSALLSLGIEHQFKFGGIITMNIVYNRGFFPMRNYHHILFIKGKEYNFDIVSTDTFLGITVGYFHWPFGYKRKMKKMKDNQDNKKIGNIM